MLFAVEGGGFFSSSASGYSKGLTLLFFGHNNKNEEKQMRVSPWSNQYQLVEQEASNNPDLQLASRKNRLVRGCASFVCFGRAAAGLESSSPSPSLKVGPTQQHQENLPGPGLGPGGLTTIKGKDHHIRITNPIDGDHHIRRMQLALRSSLKDCTNSTDSVSSVAGNESEALYENDDRVERRKVQWMDASGGDLAEIREYEPRSLSGRYYGIAITIGDEIKTLGPESRHRIGRKIDEREQLASSSHHSNGLPRESETPRSLKEQGRKNSQRGLATQYDSGQGQKTAGVGWRPSTTVDGGRKANDGGRRRDTTADEGSYSLAWVRAVIDNVEERTDAGGSDDEFDNGNERSCSCKIM
ncbi:hypothetical protein RHSIM_Rhsim06G0091600 [Rhododendron simsii]|uniref:Uncharacterized protein n=1 Tax=Rhododendron simsii TaxID=118357 RepID=A0A834LJ41_RHOSS|nr:hypothetical protein RHSIM_Rhsim06G0091600 [Rhododendron simsii]